MVVNTSIAGRTPGEDQQLPDSPPPIPDGPQTEARPPEHVGPSPAGDYLLRPARAPQWREIAAPGETGATGGQPQRLTAVADLPSLGPCAVDQLLMIANRPCLLNDRLTGEFPDLADSVGDLRVLEEQARLPDLTRDAALRMIYALSLTCLQLGDHLGYFADLSTRIPAGWTVAEYVSWVWEHGPLPPLREPDRAEFQLWKAQRPTGAILSLDIEARVLLAAFGVGTALKLRQAVELGRGATQTYRNLLATISARVVEVGAIVSSSAYQAILDWADALCRGVLEEAGFSRVVPGALFARGQDPEPVLESWSYACERINALVADGAVNRLLAALEVEYTKVRGGAKQVEEQKSQGPAGETWITATEATRVGEALQVPFTLVDISKHAKAEHFDSRPVGRNRREVEVNSFIAFLRKRQPQPREEPVDEEELNERIEAAKKAKARERADDR
jgi:hypothetical protein